MKIQPPASLIPATRFLPVHPKVQHQVSTRKEPAYPRSARERWQVLRLPLPQPARSLRAVARLWLPDPPRAAPIPRRDPAANAPGRSVPIRHQWPHSISWRTLKRAPCHCCLCRRRLIHFHCTPNTKIMPIRTRHFGSCKNAWLFSLPLNSATTVLGMAATRCPRRSEEDPRTAKLDYFRGHKDSVNPESAICKASTCFLLDTV